jgi:hypothetical protein
MPDALSPQKAKRLTKVRALERRIEEDSDGEYEGQFGTLLRMTRRE